MGNFLSRADILGFKTTLVTVGEGQIMVRELPADVLLDMAQSGAVETFDQDGAQKSRVHLDQIDLVRVALRTIIEPETMTPMFGEADIDLLNNAGFGVVGAVAAAAFDLSGWATKTSAESAEDAGPNP